MILFYLRVVSSKLSFFKKNQSHLQGKQAELCEATFDPSSGTLEPDSRLEVMVNFTSHTDVSLQVTGMNIYGATTFFFNHYMRFLPLVLKYVFSPAGADRSDCTL